MRSLDETDIRGIGLAFRDLAEQLHLDRLEASRGALTIVWTPAGLKITAAGHTLAVPDSALDAVGLVPAMDALPDPVQTGRALLADLDSAA